MSAGATGAPWSGLLRAAGWGLGAAIVGLLLFGRAPGPATVLGSTVCAGDVEVVVTVNDCGDAEGDAVVLGRWSGACGDFAVEVPTVGPGIGYVCAWQRDGGRIVRAARHRGADPGTLRPVAVGR